MFTLLHDADQTQLDTLLEVVRVARPDDPVNVSGRGWDDGRQRCSLPGESVPGPGGVDTDGDRFLSNVPIGGPTTSAGRGVLIDDEAGLAFTGAPSPAAARRLSDPAGAAADTPDLRLASVTTIGPVP